MSADLPAVGTDLPSREHTPDNVQLFLYNATLFNAHRIHYDLPYATGVEGYPGLVIAGPMIGDWLGQCVDDWLGDDGLIVELEYSNRLASYIGETLTAGGSVTAVDETDRRVSVDLFVKNEAGDVITPGRAVVKFTAT